MVINFLYRALTRKDKIFLWGTGRGAKIFVKAVPLKIDCFVDNDRTKWGTLFHGSPVQGPDILLNENLGKIIVIIASYYFCEISLQLQEMGLKKNIHYINGFYTFWFGGLGDPFALRMQSRFNLNTRVMANLVSLPFIWVLNYLFKITMKMFKGVNRAKIKHLYHERIGHLAMNTELYLRRRAKEPPKKNELDVIISSKNSLSNRQLLEMIKRKISVFDNNTVKRLLYKMAAIDPSYWTIETDPNIAFPANFNEYRELNDIPPQLSFTFSEEKKGNKLLVSMGINGNSQFVCFHSRDHYYLKETFPDFDYSYHSYRDCTIENYLSAAEYLAGLGIYALRMGNKVTEHFSINESKIIDYASKFRTDFGDVYLLAKSKFFIGNTAGLYCLAQILGIPSACANWIPLQNVPLLNSDIFIPKKLWSVEEKRLLTFREIVSNSIDNWFKSEEYSKAGIEVLENTADEVRDLVREMNQRLDETWVPCDEDEELQRRFWCIFPQSHKNYGVPSRIGSEFLRQNRNLLE